MIWMRITKVFKQKHSSKVTLALRTTYTGCVSVYLVNKTGNNNELSAKTDFCLS